MILPHTHAAFNSTRMKSNPAFTSTAVDSNHIPENHCYPRNPQALYLETDRYPLKHCQSGEEIGLDGGWYG
jgi:hypothetical protein